MLNMLRMLQENNNYNNSSLYLYTKEYHDITKADDVFFGLAEFAYEADQRSDTELTVITRVYSC